MIKVTITEEHLDRALAQLGSQQSIVTRCVFAEAAKDVISDFATCSWESVTLKDGGDLYAQGNDVVKLRGLIYDFDNERYVDVRAQLPMTVNVGEKEMMGYNSIG